MSTENGDVSPTDPHEPQAELEQFGQEFLAEVHALLAARTNYLAGVMRNYNMDIGDVDMAAINAVEIDSDIDTLPDTTRWYFNAREHLIDQEDKIFASSLLYKKSDESIRPHYYIYHSDSLMKQESYFDAGDGEWRQRQIKYSVNNDGVIRAQVGEEKSDENRPDESDADQVVFNRITESEHGYVLTVKEARDLVLVLRGCGAKAQEYYAEASKSL